MVTSNQLTNIFKKCRVPRKKKNKVPILAGCPHKKAQCVRLVILSPKKPNSARRKAAKILITSTKRQIYCYIPGIGHSLQKHSTILIRGGRRRDLPGIKYTAIRGKYDFAALLTRKNARSKYGTPKYR